MYNTLSICFSENSEGMSRFCWPKKGSGVYKVYPKKGLTLEVYCDMDTDGGGWTVKLLYNFRLFSKGFNEMKFC